MNDKRVTFKVLGRNIGTATGWDELGDNDIILYEFIPDSRFDLPSGDLGVLFEAGRFVTYDSDGNEANDIDMVAALAGSEAEAA